MELGRCINNALQLKPAIAGFSRNLFPVRSNPDCAPQFESRYRTSTARYSALFRRNRK
jgi:hypothetical protein